MELTIQMPVSEYIDLLYALRPKMVDFATITQEQATRIQTALGAQIEEKAHLEPITDDSGTPVESKLVKLYKPDQWKVAYQRWLDTKARSEAERQRLFELQSKRENAVNLLMKMRSDLGRELAIMFVNMAIDGSFPELKEKLGL